MDIPDPLSFTSPHPEYGYLKSFVFISGLITK